MEYARVIQSVDENLHHFHGETRKMDNTDVLKGKITCWLNEQGYPLEMRIAATLQGQGFRVIQSEYFADPESGDAREIDVVALKQEDINNVLFRISLLIECKRSTDKPWLLFTSNQTHLSNRARVAQRAANSLGRHYLKELSEIDTIHNLPIFTLPQRAAYGVTQAFTAGKDIPYSAVTSVSKATLSAVMQLEEMKEKDKKKILPFFRPIVICALLFPVVVVEGQLFEVFLNDSTNMEINNLDNGTLIWRNPIIGMPHTIINIVTYSGFNDFSNNISLSISELFRLSGSTLSEHMMRAIARENKPSLGNLM